MVTWVQPDFIQLILITIKYKHKYYSYYVINIYIMLYIVTVMLSLWIRYQIMTFFSFCLSQNLSAPVCFRWPQAAKPGLDDRPARGGGSIHYIYLWLSLFLSIYIPVCLRWPRAAWPGLDDRPPWGGGSGSGHLSSSFVQTDPAQPILTYVRKSYDFELTVSQVDNTKYIINNLLFIIIKSEKNCIGWNVCVN